MLLNHIHLRFLLLLSNLDHSPQGTIKSEVAPPCSSTSKSAQKPDNIVGAIWKRPPTGSTSSSLKEATRDEVQPKLSSTISTEVPTSIPPSNTTKSQKYPTSKSHKYPASKSGHVPPHISPPSHISPNMPANMTPIILSSSDFKTSSRVSQINQQQNNSEEPKENSTKSKSLRVKSYPDWPVTMDFDGKEEVLTIDAKGNVKLVSGSIQTIDVWSNNDIKYYVEFNDLYQPLRKGGQMLVRFIGSIAKVEKYCPLEEGEWPDIDGDVKGKMIDQIRDRFVIPDHPEYNKQILKRANKSWRQYKHSLKVTYYKPDEKTLAEMCDVVPRHGISSAQWRKLVKYWASDEGQISVRPVGYGLGVRKSDVYGVHGVLRKQGYGKVRERNVVMESVKEDVLALSKKNETLEKENGKLQAQVKENSFLLRTLIGQFAQLVGQVRTGTASTESLRLAQEVLSMSHNR
ncbi:hypothetical protein SOVF_173020, partial [Spinacia oleracea]